MSILNGGFGSRAVAQMTDGQFLALFVTGITADEWAYLGNLPPITRTTQLCNVVVRLRQLLAAGESP